MRSATAGGLLWTLVVLTTVACAGKPAQAPSSKPESGSSLASAAPIGVTVPAMVELGDMYRAPETYDVKITVIEILRGEKSLDFLRKAGVSKVQAQNGFEYVLAHIRLEYNARGAPGDKVWELSGEQFAAFSGHGEPYENPSIVPPQSGLNKVLHSGESLEGWDAFLVAGDDKKPVMVFSPGGTWFHLY